MELKQLQYFRAAAKRNSISQAAEALYITQPALSRCIRRLEEEVGTPLFTRTSNGVRLTPAGEAFLEELDQMFLHFERGLNNARLAAQQQHPLLSVVYSFEEFDNGVLEQMHNDFPDVRTSISILPPEQAYRELLAGKTDFAVLPRLPNRSGVLCEHLLSEEMLLSVAENSPLYGRQTVSLEELDGCTLVCNEVAYDWETIEQICQQHHITLKLLLSSNDHQVVGRFKTLMNSMLFIPISGVAKYAADGRNPVLPSRIVPQVFRREVYVAWPEAKRLSTAEKHFLELLRGSYRRQRQTIQAFTAHTFGAS